ncbi:MAG: hypothetical protein J1F36_05570 [Clostridiales bacterium]|nr:hypothetical protein [Clostridiales bacterium]
MRKVARTIAILLITAFITMSIYGCQNIFIKVNRYEFTEAGKITVAYPSMRAADIAYSMDAIYYGNVFADFYADSFIGERELNIVVTYTMQVLEVIKPEKKITCYISNSLGTMLGYDPTVMYLSEYDARSLDHLMNTITVAFEGKVPYGLMYGLAQRISEANHWGLKFKQGKVDSIQSYLTAHPNALDMQAPDFYDITNANVDLSRMAALSFVDYLENQEPLIGFYKSLAFGDERLEEYKHSWANSIGVEATTGMPCAFSLITSKNSEVAIRSEYVDLFIPINYIDYYNYYYGGEFYNYDKNYNSLKRFVTPALLDIIGAAQEIDNYLDQREKPQIHFSSVNEVNNDNNICYTAGVYYILNVYLLYRYHYDVLNTHDYNVYSEACTTYLINKYNQNEIFAFSEYDKFGFRLSDEYYERLELVKAKYPQYADYTIAPYYDYSKMLCYALAYLNQNSDPYIIDDRLRYYDASFIFYIADNYGFEALDRLRLGEDYIDVLGLSYEDLTASWWDYVLSLFV